MNVQSFVDQMRQVWTGSVPGLIEHCAKCITALNLSVSPSMYAVERAVYSHYKYRKDGAYSTERPEYPFDEYDGYKWGTKRSHAFRAVQRRLPLGDVAIAPVSVTVDTYHAERACEVYRDIKSTLPDADKWRYQNVIADNTFMLVSPDRTELLVITITADTLTPEQVTARD